MDNAAPCRRCLLEEIADERAIYAIIEERIRLLPDGERADAGEYARRLNLCKACGDLNRGTCAKCGCYVEIRAAKHAMHCPQTKPKW